MLAKFIQEQRKKRNLTQEYLASKLGISRPTLVQIEQGDREITISEGKKIAEIFEIPFNDFLIEQEPSVAISLEEEKKTHDCKKRNQNQRSSKKL